MRKLHALAKPRDGGILPAVTYVSCALFAQLGFTSLDFRTNYLFYSRMKQYTPVCFLSDFC